MGPAAFLSLLRQFVWRHARLHPLISALNVASIGLGVGVYLSVQVANHSATRAFGASIDLVSGKTQLEVRAASGGIDDALIPQIRDHPGVAAATPILEAYATLPDFPGEYVRLLGIDVFTNAEFQTAEIGSGSLLSGADGERWLTHPRQILLARSFADAHGLEVGDPLAAQIDGTQIELEVAALRDTDSLEDATSDRFALIDIGWLQELLDRPGEIASLQLVLDEKADRQAVRKALGSILPEEVVVSNPDQRSGQIETMLRGFQLNLTALSLVSILVGVFLIYNTVAASVVRRRSEIGTLRATGASRRTVRALFLGEAGLYALLGALAGVPLGLVLAKALVGQVSSVISMHYLLVHVGKAFTDPIHVAEAVAYGILAALAGAWIPATEAAGLPPALALRPISGEAQQAAVWRWRVPAGLSCLVACALLGWASLHHLPPGWAFVSCFLLMVGFSLLIPTAMRLLAFPLRFLVRGRIALVLAVDNLTRSLHRNSMTAAALMASIAMMVGISVMVKSFRETVDLWLGETIVADIFVSPAANEQIGMKAFLDPAIREAALELPGVLSSDTHREVVVEEADLRYALSVIGGQPRNNLPLVRPSAEAEAGAWREGDRALVNEPYSRRFGVREGDTVSVPTPAGKIAFEILGVYYDYADDQGQLAISEETFARHWGDSRYNSLALYLEPGTDSGPVIEALQRRFSTAGELSIYASGRLRERVLEIFDQTFAITYVLRTIAVAVAVAGIILTLTTLVRERTREIAILRSIGASRAQVATSYLCEAGCIGLCSALVGIVCGLGLSILLTHVVNLAFFGWTVRYQIPWAELAPIPIWATLVAALAGILPARLAALSDPAPALREL